MQKDSFDIYACQRQCRFFLSVCWLDILLNDTSDLVAKKRTFPDDRITSWLKLQVQINFLCIFGLPCVLNMWVCLKKLHYQILFIVLVKCYQQCSALMLSQCKNTLLSVIFWGYLDSPCSIQSLVQKVFLDAIKNIFFRASAIPNSNSRS